MTLSSDVSKGCWPVPTTAARVLLGGRSDAALWRIEPTVLVVERPEDDPLMQEELFGPLRPMITVADLETALDRVRERLLSTTRSGGVCFNDMVIQAGVTTLPFGGVGESDMGTCHGEAGFLTFSHRRSVLRRFLRLDPPFRYPPYAGRRGLLEKLFG